MHTALRQTSLETALINRGLAENWQEALIFKEELKDAILQGEDPRELLYSYDLEQYYLADLLW